MKVGDIVKFKEQHWTQQYKIIAIHKTGKVILQDLSVGHGDPMLITADMATLELV